MGTIYCSLSGGLTETSHGQRLTFYKKQRYYRVNSELFRRGLGYILSGLIVGLFSIVFFTTPVHAVVTAPNIMNFQGRLTDTSGNPLNGSYDMQLKLWDSPTVGTVRWSETRLAANGQAVTVTNGLFSLKLGVGSTQTGSLTTAFSSYPNLYFEITVGAETLTTRSQVATSAYAFNSDTLDGIDSTAFSQLSTANAFTNTNSITTASASAFIVNNGTSNIFKVDSSGTGQVVIGTSDTNGTVLVLDSNASDPTGTNGAMYYNSGGKFRCYQGGAWADCITAAGGATLQTAYNASGTPATITTTAAKGVSIVAGAAPTADIFNVSNIGQPNVTAGVSGVEVNYVGGAAAVEASGVRVDLTPGTTTGGTWNGMRVVANPTGAASGVSLNGIKLEGPTAPGTGTETAVSVGTGWDIGLDLNSGGLQLGVQNDPTTPAAGELRVYAKAIAGRTMLKALSPTGVDYVYQPSLFQQSVVMVTPGNGATATTYTSLGGSLTVSGTLAAATGINDAMGSMSNIASGTTANTGAGFQTVNLQYFRGTGSNNADGFFYATRVNFSGNTAMTLAKYNSATTGARFFAGVASVNIQGTGSMTASDNPSGSYAGFQYSAIRDTNGNFRFITEDGTTQNVVDTGVALAVSKTFDFYTYCAPGGTTAYWRVDNLTDGTTTEGNTASNLPAAATGMRAGVALAPLSTTAIHYRFQRMYVETDR